jgi:hypothetical protein
VRLFEIPGGIPSSLPIRAFGRDADHYCWEDWHAETKPKYPVRYFVSWTLANWWKNRIAAPLRRLFRGRWLKFWWQRRTRGWDDSVTWNLDTTIARFALPRLRRFRELPHGYWHPVAPEMEADLTGFTPEEESRGIADTERVLDEIEWFLSVHASEEGTWQLETPEQRERYAAACILFGKNFGHLWS